MFRAAVHIERMDLGTLSRFTINGSQCRSVPRNWLKSVAPEFLTWSEAKHPDPIPQWNVT
jgi:hypothetical protein